ncbi:DNA-binding protein [Acinetobacter sp. Tr-809]|uniref:DNA-binding protein n=1 Tax=Acinetobacter sp. Tr-809 TaxID=2608324 RepID=UPI00141EEBD9|nr:DNA-binding protein [Acinetobacter sp. Tr-809]NIE95642.1 DNA-binding protein [Acinetobacter sp. Tr-809]
MARLTKLDRMSPEEKTAESNRFWAANDSAQFPPETVAIVLGLSLSWLQNKRTNGGGIPFFKPDGRKIIYYLKADVINYINKNKLKHTA